MTCDWFVDNKLSIHLGKDKTNSILFSSKSKVKQVQCSNGPLVLSLTSQISYIVAAPPPPNFRGAQKFQTKIIGGGGGGGAGQKFKFRGEAKFKRGSKILGGAYEPQ